jgi:hypothetical protein
MKKGLAGSLALGLILGVSPYGAAKTFSREGLGSDKRITIRVHNYAQIDTSDLLKTEQITDDIFRETGVEAAWLECSAGDAPAKDPACEIPMTPMDLELNLLPRSMSQRFLLGADRFGVALEDAQGGLGFDAWIFCDLVKDAAAKKHLTPSVLLGTVIAHELGHLLLSTNSHSAFGIMRAKWSNEELSAVEHRAMYFSSSESARIQKAVTARQLFALNSMASVRMQPQNLAGGIPASR